VGEVRGGEALALLKSWNTGHSGGVATLHANSARAGLLRLEQLIAEVSTAPMAALIAEAIDVIIFIEKISGGRRISEIIGVLGLDKHSDYIFATESDL
jgi:type IV secretion system protein VirB11